MAGRTPNFENSKKNYTKREKLERKHLKELLDNMPEIEISENEEDSLQIIQALKSSEITIEEKVDMIAKEIIKSMEEAQLPKPKQLDIINFKMMINAIIQIDRLEKSIALDDTKYTNAKGEVKANPDIDSLIKYQAMYQKLSTQIGITYEQRTRALKLTAQLLADETDVEEEEIVQPYNPMNLIRLSEHHNNRKVN